MSDKLKVVIYATLSLFWISLLIYFVFAFTNTSWNFASWDSQVRGLLGMLEFILITAYTFFLSMHLVFD